MSNATQALGEQGAKTQREAARASKAAEAAELAQVHAVAERSVAGLARDAAVVAIDSACEQREAAIDGVERLGRALASAGEHARRTQALAQNSRASVQDAEAARAQAEQAAEQAAKRPSRLGGR